MALFKRRTHEDQPGAQSETAAAPPIPTELITDALAAHSAFIKQVNCARCGAPKSLPSITAYLYCDKCGALVDYDFRLANQDTNAGITNTVFHQLIAPYGPSMAQAIAAGDRDGYRATMLWVFQEWLAKCPDAASPRARTDAEFRDRMIRYCAESAVCKAFDPRQQQLEAQTNLLIASLPRIPTPGGAWRVQGDAFWQMAALWKQQMELAYELMGQTGVTDMDPDEPPPGVALKMEYSTFCQAWLPHLSPEDGQRVLAMYGMTGDYRQPPAQATEQHHCGGCGADLVTVVGAQVVVCERCGLRIEISAGPVPCQNCGAPLDFPVATSRLTCPYCKVATARV